MRKVDPKKHEAKRQQILDAAIQCFGQKGFHQTSTAEICAAAGMSPGNLFHYFPSKDAIIEAIVEAERREAEVAFDRLYKAPDIFAGLLELIDLSFKEISDPIHARLGMEIAAEVTRNPRVAELFARSEGESKEQLVKVLKLAADRGQIDASLDMKSAATWLIALLDGAVGRAALDPSFNVKKQAPMLRLLVTRFLQPQPQPQPQA